MLKIVLDTNVIISGLLFGGKPRMILEAVIEGQIRLGISQQLLDELRGVLSGAKFRFDNKVLHELENELLAMAEFVEPRQNIKKIKKDPADNMVLECAAAYGADTIISGDEHVLDLGRFQSAQILSPAEFVSLALK